mgnify:CR=1 FL=1
MIGFGTKVNADGSINGWNGEDTGVWIKPYGTNSIKLAGSFDDINNGTHQSATTVMIQQLMALILQMKIGIQ